MLDLEEKFIEWCECNDKDVTDYDNFESNWLEFMNYVNGNN